MQVFNTKNGVFGPGGHGGGIFQTTVSGLGSLGVEGLGTFDPFTGVPSACWDEFGFKGCSAKASQSANDFLATMSKNGDIDYKPGSPEWAEKYSRLWNDGLKQCMKDYCGGASSTTSSSESVTAGMLNLPLSKYSDITKAVQQDANQVLPGMGLPLLSPVDGKMGPKTCQAIAAIVKGGKIEGWVIPKACAGLTSGPSTVSTTSVTSTSKYSNSSSSSTSLPDTSSSPFKNIDPDMAKKVAMVAGGVALVLGGFYMMRKK